MTRPTEMTYQKLKERLIILRVCTVDVPVVIVTVNMCLLRDVVARGLASVAVSQCKNDRIDTHMQKP
jgi:hypothetical protein